jgi:hypothetical protein
MEIRWFGEVELTFNPSFYPSLVRISMARRPPVISHSGWATVKPGPGPGQRSSLTGSGCAILPR